MNKVGGYDLRKGEVLRVASGYTVFYVDEEQKYREAIDYFVTRGMPITSISVEDLDGLI
jgi:hypothetical protein